MPIGQQTKCETSTNPCKLCENNQVAVLASRSRNNKPLRTVICQKCGLAWSDPFPYNPRQFYESEYRIEYKKTCAPKPKHILRAGKVALTRYKKIQSLLSKRKSILDVGTGGGEFAYLLKSLGHDIHGIEPNRSYAEYSIAEYQLNLQIGFIQDNQFEASSFDVITIWHVLEHTEDPYLVLCKLRDLLKPEGTLIVEVPNIEAICQAPKSTFHEAHLYHFNIETLSGLAEKAGLIAENHLFSADSGNFTIFFRKPNDGHLNRTDWTILENADRINALVQGHTNLKHYLSKTPYLRFLNRIFRTIGEKNNVYAYENNKSLLDDLYKNANLIP